MPTFNSTNRAILSGRNFLLLLAAALLLQACQWSGDQVAGRWYSHAQVLQGKSLYEQNCASCHLANASGTVDWKQRNAAGALPPPPLDGTAHAWHHSLTLLDEIIREGGAPWQGTMPAFKEQLNAEQRRSVIAYLQSLWSEQIYLRWHEATGG